eukprot:scaffold49765_cov47-Phaeocystis_antarctica.AAC.3
MSACAALAALAAAVACSLVRSCHPASVVPRLGSINIGLQPLVHMVAAPITWGCSLSCIGL